MRSTTAAGLALALLVVLPLYAMPGAAQSQAPDGELSLAWTCQKLTCQFEASNASSAVEGNVSAVAWTFGPNGTQATGNPVSHTFPQAGTYEVQVTVTGNQTGNATGNQTTNATATAIREVTVSAGDVPWSALGIGVVALAGSIVLARTT